MRTLRSIEMSTKARRTDIPQSDHLRSSVSAAVALRSDRTKSEPPGLLNVLLVSKVYHVPYRVLRCAHAAGSNVYVLGTDGAKNLESSRYCSAFIRTDRPVDGGFDEELAEQINLCVERHGIDIVLPGDAPSTRSLIAIRDLIRAPCFPMPDLAQFDRLNNKWEFNLLCMSLGIECPKSRMFLNTQDLAREIDRDSLAFPLIVKPLTMDGGVGVIKLNRETAREQIAAIFYGPILVQDFIEGIDIGAGVFCRNGEIRAFIAHSLVRGNYSAFFDEAIYSEISKIMRALKVDGVFNFDMRRTPDGRVFYLECNPRIFFKIAMSMLAGINFVSLGLPDRGSDVPARLSHPVTVPSSMAMLRTLRTPWKLKTSSLQVLKFLFGDPIPYFRDSFMQGSHLDERPASIMMGMHASRVVR